MLVEDYNEVLDDGGKGLLRRVRAAAQRMSELIDDLLQLARVSRSELRRQSVDLSRKARGVLAELQQGEPDRRVEVAVEDGLVVEADDRLLGVVLENLLGNAWKFTSKKDGARIELTGLDIEGESGYRIRDNGAGFDMTYANKLFRPFQRLHSEGDFPGTGIGLATVQRVIERHGGRVWAEGAVGGGATFFFVLGKRSVQAPR
jgi:light-regulated signal transduction histidine kinase (bacteriophytochrome)